MEIARARASIVGKRESFVAEIDETADFSRSPIYYVPSNREFGIRH